MQKFEYRTPRFSVDLPVKFIAENTVLTGRSRDIGKEGMTLDLAEAVQPGAVGTVSVSHQGRTVEVRARVAHVDGTHTGVEFLPDSEADRAALAQLVASLATVPPRSGPVLLH
ncbi:MAG TPA: PilZ domain-containing protein [Acidobacteriaceae bacterium]|jgi:hypothetical protein|nr:PilZ domain-containing protein [Acidobacteriaceae bacterium]